MDPEKRRFYEEFQSTPSARRATETYPAGGGAVYISIHALREEGDMFLDEFDHIIKEFQSTPSARRATSVAVVGGKGDGVFQSTPSARRATALNNMAKCAR